MKRLFAAALAVLLMLSITISAFAADSPLAASDRITAQLTDIQKRREEIEKTISQRETAKKVATFRGKNMTESQGLNYFINRKIMTKRDFEAFKWSFIFSQFAVPLEDSLLDVLSDEVVNKMINDNFTITGVKEFIITGSSDNEENNVTNEVSMLQDVNVPELVETIKENYAVYPIFKENGSQPTLGDILNPAPLSIFEKFYLKDTLAKGIPDGMYKDAANSLFYNQDLLENFKSEIVFEDVDIPVFVYDANSYMYLQIGIGAYLKSNGDKSKAELLAERGEEILCIDSYGNICSKSANGSATILLPNFGNSFLNARETSAGSSLLEESINLYNKWFVTLYTRHSRDDNKIYPDITRVEYLDTPSAEGSSATGKMTFKGDGIAKSHYSNYLTVNVGNDLSNTLLLVETGGVSVKPKLSATQGFSQILKDSAKANSGSSVYTIFSHFDGKGSKSLNIDFVQVSLGEKRVHAHSAVTLANELFDYLKLHTDTLFDDKEEDNFAGYSKSAYNHNIDCFAPFVATNTDQDFYLNKYPILFSNIALNKQNSGTNDAIVQRTHINRFAKSLVTGIWKINDTRVHSSTSSESTPGVAAILGMEDVATLITTFKDTQILDNRFASVYQTKSSNGYFNTEVYLPKTTIDVGQNMAAYINDEKGMFLVDYKLYSTSIFDSFRKYINEANDLFTSNLNAAKNSDKKITLLSLEDIKSIIALIGLPNQVLNDYEKLAKLSTIPVDYKTQILYDSGECKSTIFMYNDSNSKNDALQGGIYFPWTYDLNGAFTQSNLESLYRYQSNSSTKYIYKVDIYEESSKPANSQGDFKFKAYTSTRRYNSNDTTLYNYELIETYYYYKSTKDGKCFPYKSSYQEPSFNNIFGDPTSRISDISSFFDFVNHEASSEDMTNLVHLFTYDLTELLLKTVGTWCGDKGNGVFDMDSVDNRGLDFHQLMEEIQTYLHIDANILINSYICLFSAMWIDEDLVNDGLHNNYYYDEYQYFLRNPTYLSNVLGYKTSNGDPTANDFATITYFWDRHYLLQSAFNSQMMKEVEANWKGVKNQSPASMSSIYEAYMKDIEQNHFGIANQSLQDFVLSQKIDLLGIQVEGKTIYTPYFYEWAIQDRNQNPNASVSEQLERINSSQENITESNGQTSETEDIKISAIFGSTSAFYNYLDSDTIILYPFSRLSGEITSSELTVKAGLGDAVLNYALDAADMRNDNKVKTDLVATILALQCNTDYKHNHLSVPAAKPAEKTHVTKEELMDNANQFFTNPVTSISYIFTGFLYQVHAVIATGNLGSVFSINWLLESDVYKWVMNRYVALLAIAVGIILLLKLIQFAMNKSRDAMAIGRSIAGILAMCLVPVIIFNSFVWAFDTSSKWFMHGSLDKILLSQIDIKERERINSDPGATAELNAFKEQFNALDLNGSECLLFEEMTGYSIENGPIYKTVGIWDYMNNVIYTADDKGDWYTSKEFKSIHKSRYKESVFYYFYDFIRAEYFNYCSTVGTGGNTALIKEYVREMEEHEASAQSSSGNAHLEAIKDINTSEQSIAMLTGGFRTMLEDTTYVYGDTLLEGNKHITNGPKVKDLVGLYKIFNSAETDADVGEILKSVYYTAWENSSTMKATDSVVPKTWKDAAYLDEYFSSKINSKLQRGQASYNGMPAGKYYIITSYLDLFNKNYNNMNMTGLTINDIAITPLEEKLCALSDDIYNTTLKALNYLPKKIHDESAITLMAMIATCKLNEAFGVAPTEPVLESVTLDSFVRTAFLTDLEMVGSNVNTLYAMIAQGDSIGKVLVVVFLELIICVASVARILIILYITGASFVILGLRLLHKAPRTTDLVYGIVGNILMLLALHAITLFLVIIAVEAVAGAVSVVPSILLDILMIVFTIMMAVTLFKLVKNIAKDAVNIGGAKIKGIVHSIGDTVANAIKSVTHSKDNEINAANVTINSQTTSETPKLIADALVERRREHVNTIVQNIKQVEEEEAAIAATQQTTRESTNTQQAFQVEKNLQAEREVEDSN